MAPSRRPPAAAPAPPPPPPAPLNGSRLADTSAAAPSVPSPPKLRRRPTLIALGVALIALGGLTAAWLTTTVGNTTAVLAVAADVDRGDVITDTDLTVAQVATDPVLDPVPSGDRREVVGQRAARDLTEGTLLTATSLTGQLLPAPGDSLVGATLRPSQLPARPLRTGDQVRLVDTPRDQDDPPTAAPNTTTATVVGTRELPDTGETVVDLSVPQDQGAELAARVATGRVALVLDGLPS